MITAMARGLGVYVVSYLFGSIPTGYLLVKWTKRVDVRQHGSGNIGATNVTRVAGSRLGRVVFVLDVLKGWLPVLLIAPWGIQPFTPQARLACGVMAVVGHMFPIFLKFRGGKGVATMIGVLLGTMPLVACLLLAIWLISFAVTRTVSLSSLAAAVALPLVQWTAHRNAQEILLGFILTLLVTLRHGANIKRLLQGTEHRFGRRVDDKDAGRQGH